MRKFVFLISANWVLCVVGSPSALSRCTLPRGPSKGTVEPLLCGYRVLWTHCARGLASKQGHCRAGRASWPWSVGRDRMLLCNRNSVVIQLGTWGTSLPHCNCEWTCTPAPDWGRCGDRVIVTPSILGVKVCFLLSDKPLDLLRVKGIQHKWWRREGTSSSCGLEMNGQVRNYRTSHEPTCS